MVFKVPDAGLALESSAKSTAALPQQAFAVSLDDKAIEDMIECVQNGQDIQLSLGDTPVSFVVFLTSVLCSELVPKFCRGEAIVIVLHDNKLLPHNRP